jgi:maltose O-acetyltransferase
MGRRQPAGGILLSDRTPAVRRNNETLRSITVSVLNRVRQYVARRRDVKFAAYLQTLQSRGLVLGHNVSFQEGVFIDPSHCFLISIGDDCVLAPNVRLIAHDASTKMVAGATRLGRIRIGNRCFLGDSVIVLPGVSIGDHCIVGAGSVVSRDIPAGSVAAGNPAKVLKSTRDYSDLHRRQRQAGRSFGTGYHIPEISEAGRAEVLKALDVGPVYID